jgi:hypothetical protein
VHSVLFQNRTRVRQIKVILMTDSQVLLGARVHREANRIYKRIPDRRTNGRSLDTRNISPCYFYVFINRSRLYLIEWQEPTLDGRTFNFIC